MVELSNSTLTSLEGFLAEAPDLTITINRSDLEMAMIGSAPLAPLAPLAAQDAGADLRDGGLLRPVAGRADAPADLFRRGRLYPLVSAALQQRLADPLAPLRRQATWSNARRLGL